MNINKMLPLVEAHRGDSANAPENTLAAFKRALELAVPSIELDVHPAMMLAAARQLNRHSGPEELR